MKGQKRIRDYGIRIGELETGRRNAITDIEGIRIGHQTIDHDRVAKAGKRDLNHGAHLARRDQLAQVGELLVLLICCIAQPAFEYRVKA